jgi:hypothetical protein
MVLAFRLQILIGIVASDLRLALRSLRDYVKALDLEFVQPEIRVGLSTCKTDCQMSCMNRQHSTASMIQMSPVSSDYL